MTPTRAGIAAILLCALVSQTAAAQTADWELPLYTKSLQTRFGILTVSEEQVLLLDGRPVKETPDFDESGPEPKAAPAGGIRALLEKLPPVRVAKWLFGKEAGEPRSGLTLGAAVAAYEAAEAVAGNQALAIVAGYQIGDADVVLLQNTGGAGCPALLRFVTVAAGQTHTTREFGTCSDLARIAPGADGESLIVTMRGFAGPFEDEAVQARAAASTASFVYRNGELSERKGAR